MSSTWLRLALAGAAALAAGCASQGFTAPGGPHITTNTCVVMGTAPFQWQRCPIELVFDSGTGQYRIPDNLKDFYLTDALPALFVWRLPANSPGHFFDPNSLGLGTGNGFFLGRGTANDADGSGEGPDRSKFYRVLVLQVDSLCRQYTLTIKRTGQPDYVVDPTIANGNALAYPASAATGRTCP